MKIKYELETISWTVVNVLVNEMNSIALHFTLCTHFEKNNDDNDEMIRNLFNLQRILHGKIVEGYYFEPKQTSYDSKEHNIDIICQFLLTGFMYR